MLIKICTIDVLIKSSDLDELSSIPVPDVTDFLILKIGDCCDILKLSIRPRNDDPFVTVGLVAILVVFESVARYAADIFSEFLFKLILEDD